MDTTQFSQFILFILLVLHLKVDFEKENFMKKVDKIKFTL